MNLHPDILTDLVILYHAGEASQASRALLEQEAERNPALAAALAAGPRATPPLPGDPAPGERKVFRKLRLRYLMLSMGAVLAVALTAAAMLPTTSPAAVPIFGAMLPLFLLALLFIAGLGAFFFLARVFR